MSSIIKPDGSPASPDPKPNTDPSTQFLLDLFAEMKRSGSCLSRILITPPTTGEPDHLILLVHGGRQVREICELVDPWLLAEIDGATEDPVQDPE